MLFFLTGDVQTGKTRWLTSVLRRLRADGIGAAGVLAPGIWVEHAAADSPDVSEQPVITYEKLGIDNLLLPEGILIPFARRRDLAEQDGTFNAQSQAGRMQLAWAIDDSAIEQVNAHLDALAAKAAGSRTGGENRSNSHPSASTSTSSLLVIDEIGRLELERNEGLTSAIALVDQGATPAFPHVLVIVRSALLVKAQKRFANAPWNGMRTICADDSGENALRTSFGLSPMHEHRDPGDN